MSKVPGEVRHQLEIEQELLGAYWEGRLIAHRGDPERPVERIAMLKLVRLWPDHESFSFVESASQIPPKVTEAPNGIISVDSHRYFVLPSNSRQWSVQVLERVYSELALTTLDDFYEPIRPIVFALSVSKQEFGTYCDRASRPRPVFWFEETAELGGFGGRPSAMRLIAEEMRNRHEQGNLAPRVREEAQALAKWAKENLPSDFQAPLAKSIENAVRSEYRTLTQRPSEKHKT